MTDEVRGTGAGIELSCKGEEGVCMRDNSLPVRRGGGGSGGAGGGTNVDLVGGGGIKLGGGGIKLGGGEQTGDSNAIGVVACWLPLVGGGGATLNVVNFSGENDCG